MQVFAAKEEAGRVRARSLGRGLSSGWMIAALLALMATMMTAAVGSSFYVASQQHQLIEIRNEARHLRMTRHALMQVDATVLRFLTRVDQKPDSVGYGKAIATLDALGMAGYPTTVKRNGADVPTTAVLASLKAAWDDMVGMLSIDAGETASETYRMRFVERDMDAMLAGFDVNLTALERRYVATQETIDYATTACLIGQILAGLVSIVSFILAAWRGARESKARAVAVSTANATREQVTRLFQMTDMLQSASDLGDANAVLRSTATELLPGFGAALYVFNNSRDRLVLATHWGMDRELLSEAVGLNQCWALKRGKPHLNVADEHRLRCEHHHSPDCALEIPMIARGEILGLLQIHAAGDDAEDRLNAVASVAAAIADGMSLALANLALRDKLRSQALRDPLTGLYNRRYMEDTLERVVRLAEREKREVSLVMIDLDHFKRLNDNYGHAKGDAVLRDVAAVIVSALRDSDVACRYGGEELLVILPHCGLDAAAKKAERLRSSIAAMSEPGGAQISASFGVASIPETSSGPMDLMQAADAALYEAKQAGRNRVMTAAVTQVGKRPEDSQEELRLAAE